MSGIFTTGLTKIAPSAAGAVAVTAGGSAWTNGAWVQLLAATSASAVLLGINAISSGSGNREYEVEIGTGGAGAEITFATLAFHHGNISGPNVWLFPIPISGIANGARIAARIRCATASSSTSVAIYYSENFDAEQITALAHTNVPTAAAGASVTPSGTGWANSPWVQLTSGIGDNIGASGLTFVNAVTTVDAEFDIGFGGAGSEVVATTMRWSAWYAGGLNGCGLQDAALPWVLPIPVSTRVAIRMRKTGTDTTAWVFKLLYYTGLTTGQRSRGYMRFFVT